MRNNSIKHIWFDFSDTIASIHEENHNKLRYETYSKIVKKPTDQQLIEEFEQLYTQHRHSNSAVFHALGESSDFWSQQIGSMPPQQLYKLAEPTIPQILQNIRQIVPISIFSNINLTQILPTLGIELNWFDHIISSGMFKQPKPALDGFYKIVELSKLPAAEILYIGDDIGKDIRPAKQVGLRTGLMWRQSVEADYSFSKFEDIIKILV